MRVVVALVSLPALLVVLTATAAGEAVWWSGNGHGYEARLRPEGINWETAEAECEADLGYLATLESEAENEFVFGLVSGESSFWYIDGYQNGIGPWLGGLQTPGSQEPGEGWHWVTGEPWSYTNWALGEPNNFGGDEDRAHLFGYRTLIGSEWNDLNWDEGIHGYIFETEAASAVEEASWGRIKAVTGR